MSTRKLVKAVKALFNPGKQQNSAASRNGRRTARSNQKLVKNVNNLIKPISRLARAASKQIRQTIWLLRTLVITGRHQRQTNSGFVLPTVVMVTLVVILLTTAILFRSFDRSKNASNVRVSQVVLNASAPAIDRAKAKLDALFTDPRLPRSTPSDFSLYEVINGNLLQYTFEDENQLKLVSEFNGQGGIQSDINNLDNNETLTTAWKFPVDTDNNGKFDSYTLYGIYFRTPSVTNRARSPLEARTPPMDEYKLSGLCKNTVATSANLISSGGWYNSGSKLKKSIFVYTATVPITDLAAAQRGDPDPTNATRQYETYKGNKGFSALEYEQDRGRIPLSNNAVLYEDDLQIAPGAGLKLNGRVFTNSNLLTGQAGGNPIRLYLVSSPSSCFYLEENSKVVVGGNVGNSTVTSTADLNSVRTDLFQGQGNGPKSDSTTVIDSTQKSVSSLGSSIAYNSKAYSARINLLVNAGITGGGAISTTGVYPNLKVVSGDPSEVKKGIESQINTDNSLILKDVRSQQMEIYFRRRTRRVPYAEVAADATDLKQIDPYTVGSTSVVKGSGDTLRPPKEWAFPFDPSDGITSTNYAKLDIALNGGKKIELPATEPKTQQQNGKEDLLGDRVLVGNNLPEVWYKPSGTGFGSYDTDTNGKFVTTDPPLDIKGKVWDSGGDPSKSRSRVPQAFQLSDLGIIDRDGFWEKKAAEPPKAALDVVGGLRVVTGAGVYYPTGSVLKPAAPKALDNPNTLKVDESKLPSVWPDLMPMSNGLTPVSPQRPDSTKRGDLVMRATVVYHYKNNSYNPDTPNIYQTPIACVSSYYDPSTKDTAVNRLLSPLPPIGLPDVRLRDASPEVAWSDTALTGKTDRALTGLATVAQINSGSSNNGVTYSVAGLETASSISGISVSNGIFAPPGDPKDPADPGLSLADRLSYQANLVFPSGRFVNQPLRNALTKVAGGQFLTLSEQSAIDSTICALRIADKTLDSKVSDSVVPHGAIRETAFLDARQIKAIDSGTLTGSYDLNIEQRQPLEIRATVLDLDLLRRTSIAGGTEFLLPYSGIIYATRDDALPDASDISDQSDATKPTFNTSSTDWKLDPTRRPNGIMLINGQDLSRNAASYNPQEKGLILASNLPVYTKGDFNLHQHEEFQDTTLSIGGSPDFAWKNFYNRASLDSNFACRPGQFAACNTGDTWRPGTILADAITVLSDNYRLGFRNEGDYDLNDNAGHVLIAYDYDGNGTIDPSVQIDENAVQFDLNNDGNVTDTVPTSEANIPATVANRRNGFWDNNFVTSLPWQDTFNNYGNPVDSNGNPLKSSYFNNFITPIQRRGQSLEYAMEICRQMPASQCGPTDWKVDLDVNGLPLAGTTAKPATKPEDRRYPRRVAFLRDAGNLHLPPTPLGIDINGKVTNIPVKVNNALWFKTISGDSPLVIANLAGLKADKISQPLLVPVLQTQAPTANPPNVPPLGSDSDVFSNTNWLQTATQTTTNLVFAQGDTPARPTSATVPGEYNGGLENFVRYLERWNPISCTNSTVCSVNHIVSGSFIELKHSVYSTAPWQTLTSTYNGTSSIPNFGLTQGYTTSVNDSSSNRIGRSPFYAPPNRQWGFDVALLSQLPDLFSQRFTTPAAGDPNQYFREVGRDDTWVETLLCAGQKTDNQTTTKTYRYATDADQRPSCPNPESAYTDS